MKENNMKIHFMYVTGILITIIIILITHEFGGDNNLVQYLSFALGLTSLVVGLIAIFQTFFSGDVINNSILKLEKASSDIINNSNNLENIVDQFNTNFGQVPITLSSIQEKLESQSTVNNVYKKQGPISGNILTKEHTTTFIETGSFRGLMSLYTVFKSHETGKSFKIADFEPSTDLSNVKYSYGYLVASSSIGLFSHNENEGIWTIPTVNDNLKLVNELMEKRFHQNKDQKALFDLMTIMKEKIDLFFQKENSASTE